jgi:Transglycosylase-like domain
MRLGLTLAVASTVSLLATVVLVSRALAQEEPTPPTPGELQAKAERDKARRYARRLEKVVHRQATRAERNERTIKRQRHATRRALRQSPHGGHWLERAFLCIHQHEGSWGAATGNGYYGGLQFDLSFQRAYGDWALATWGTANRWPLSVQLATAMRAWISRGFQPWPNTRRMCGL